MFSYRHAFHAGNHADALKHTAWIAMLRYLTQKDAALTVLDTHAGAGLYRLDGEQARTSGEAADGVLRLLALPEPEAATLAPALADYLGVVRSFQRGKGHKTYPGSPFIAHGLLREHDRIKLFELHPTDSRNLKSNVTALDAGRQVAVLVEDGFEHYKKFLPPPSRRALVLIDPSYELKSDYARVQALLADALKRFPTGTYAVWHPIIPRPEAHDLPKRLRTLATKAQRPWLWASLTVKSGKRAQGLPASGLFVINPPHTLDAALRPALPQMAQWLAQDDTAAWHLESGGG
ncbi:MAG: 23S rRNA (adenine(2030)-N(6))-methyltransferase RlmJ [Burkholderiaceae bacterium]